MMMVALCTNQLEWPEAAEPLFLEAKRVAQKELGAEHHVTLENAWRVRGFTHTHTHTHTHGSLSHTHTSAHMPGSHHLAFPWTHGRKTKGMQPKCVCVYLYLYL